MNRFVFGVISLALSVISWFIFWWLSIAALILGIIGVAVKIEDEDPQRTRNGKILNIIAIIAASACLITMIVTIVIAMLAVA